MGGGAWQILPHELRHFQLFFGIQFAVERQRIDDHSPAGVLGDLDAELIDARHAIKAALRQIVQKCRAALVRARPGRWLRTSKAACGAPQTAPPSSPNSWPAQAPTVITNRPARKLPPSVSTTTPLPSARHERMVSPTRSSSSLGNCLPGMSPHALFHQQITGAGFVNRAKALGQFECREIAGGIPSRNTLRLGKLCSRARPPTPRTTSPSSGPICTSPIW